MAAKAGYTNVKVYTAGVPAWKKAKQLMVVKSGWLAKNLNKSFVVLDARAKAASAKGHIKGAVAYPGTELVKMGASFKAKKYKSSKKLLPGLVDKKAPIVIYGSGGRSADAMDAYNQLIRWGYKGSVVLDGGFAGWKKGGLDISTSVPGRKISYVRKAVKGAVNSSKFAGLVKAGSIVVLDVRTPKEVAKGKIAGSVHIPLDELGDNLAKLDKSAVIVAHCASGVRAGIAYQLLQKNGFKKAQFLNAIIKIDKSGKYRIE
ncbi:MAG: hypothetical protein H8E38_12530 [SAR324 cluster bacterium]|nr:hypothetical protein [SAR324 cluster bacterium]MBL7034841.1 hypothetical protein [SAR324 cluster bacterium]